MEARARQQAAVSELGLRALAGVDLLTLMDQAVALVAQVLEVEYAKVLDLLPGGDALLLRTGVGWQEGYVGRATVGAKTASQAGYTLLSREPVIVEDLRTETRFTGPALLVDHGVVSGMSVVIHGEQGPFGILGTHTTKRRTFTKDDSHFLQAVANVLATAIERNRAEEALRESEEKYRELIHSLPQPVFEVDETGRLTFVNRKGLELFGYSKDDLDKGLNAMQVLVPEDRECVAQMLQTTLNGEAFGGVECAALRKDGSTFPVIIHGAPVVRENRSVGIRGVVFDITKRRRAEEEIRLLLTMIQAMSEAQDFDSALEAALSKVCEATGWDFGEAWIPRPDGTAVECSPAWCSSAKSLERFRKLSEEFTFPPSTGLPGRVWSSKESEWIEDVSTAQETFFLRARIAAEAGLKAGLGVPIVADGQVLAVLAFFMLESRQEDKQMVELVSAVAAQLGSVIQRKRAEEALRRAREELEGRVERQLLRKNPYGLTFRELTVLHLVAAGRADKEIARELGISPLTASKHVANILAKMNAGSRTEAGVRALKEGLLG